MSSSVKEEVLAILIWFAFNIGTVILNRYVFAHLDFVFPLTLTLLHMGCCWLGSILLLKKLQIYNLQEVSEEAHWRRIVPLSVVFCANIVLGNISLRWVPVSFMQTVKSSVPAFTVLAETLFLKAEFRPCIAMSLVPVVAGVGLATTTEVNFHLIGFMSALIASVLTTTQTIISSMLLSGSHKLDSPSLVYYMSRSSFVMLLPPVLLWEGPAVWVFITQNSTLLVWLVLLVNGWCAYMLNWSTFYAIAKTSSLTFTVCGNLKVVFSILISVAIFRNQITVWNGIGCFITLLGVSWYQYLKYQEKLEKVEPVKTGAPTELVPINDKKLDQV